MSELSRLPCAVTLCGLLVCGAAAQQTPGAEPALFQFSGTDGPVYGVAWEPNGRRLAAVGFQQVNLWRPGVATPLVTLAGHTGFVRAVAWSPDGKAVASAGQDGTVRIWNTDTLQQTAVFETGAARAVDWSPDGTRLIVGGEAGHLQIWQVADGRRLHGTWLGATISSASWSPDGRRFAAGAINGKASLWNATTGQLEIILRVAGLSRNDVNGIAWSPHGRLLATAQGARGAGDVRLWDTHSGKLLQTLSGGGAGWLRAVRWSPDGQWIAAAGEEGDVRIWNSQTGSVAAAQTIAPQPVWSLAWSPEGASIVIGTGTFDSRSPSGTVARWTATVNVIAAAPADHARSVEAALLARGDSVPRSETRAAPPTTEFADGRAAGVVLGPDPPFGNLETSFVAADLSTVGIKDGGEFQVQCRDKSFRVRFGNSWADVPSSEWAAFVSLDGTLVLARNNASAAAASGCAAGDRVIVTK